jgi:predicted RNA-binding protein
LIIFTESSSKIKKSPKKRAKTTIKENIGKVLIDVGKLIFGSIFLGSILRGEIPQVILMISGFAVASTLLAAGVLLVTKEEKNGDNGSPPEKKE